MQLLFIARGRSYKSIIRIGSFILQYKREKSQADYTEEERGWTMEDGRWTTKEGDNRMDTGDWLVTPSCTLDEQVAREIFDILPERSHIIMIIMDREGHRWVSDPERFSKLSVRDSFWSKLCARVDDGTEPVITQADDYGVAAAELATEQTKCGYVIIILPRYDPEATLMNIELIETLLGQSCLTAKLIERNNQLCELQRKQLSSYTQRETSSN